MKVKLNLQKICQKAEEMGLTPKEFCRKAGVSLSTYYKIKNGERKNLRCKTYEKFPEILGMDPITFGLFVRE